MVGVGQLLKEERLRQGFSLEEIEEETKIRKYYLQALEEENYKVLPPQVYATGFMKRYAKFLGLDEAEFSERFKREACFEEEEDTVPQVKEPLTPINKVVLPWGNIMAGIIFLVVAIWLGNYIVGYLSERGAREAQPQTPGIQQPAEQTPAPEQEQNQSPPPSTTPAALLELKTTQACWLLVVVDGETQYTGTLPANQERVFEGKERIYLKAGNAGGLEITFNGEKQEPLGAVGEVKEREFTAE